MRGIATLALLFAWGSPPGCAFPHSSVHKMYDGRKFRMPMWFELSGIAEWSQSRSRYEGFIVDYYQAVAEELGIPPHSH